MSLSTLYRTVEKLIKLGFLKVTKQWGGKMKTGSLFYQISLKKLLSNFTQDVKSEKNNAGQIDKSGQLYVGQNDITEQNNVGQIEKTEQVYVGQNDTKQDHSILYNYNNKYINNNKREIVKRDEKFVNEVFEFWKKELNHPRAVLDAKRKKLIANALSTHDVQFLKEAISGNKLSKWHQGGNSDGKVYNSIELILRDNYKIESFQQIFEVQSQNIASQQKREAELFTPKETIPASNDEWKNLMLQRYGDQFEKVQSYSNLQIST